jgi:hypothetical protein
MSRGEGGRSTGAGPTAGLPETEAGVSYSV